MKILRYCSTFLLAGILVLLDTSFFSNLPIGNATIISTLAAIILFSFTGNPRDLISFVSFAIIFFSIFSSLPIWLIFFTFLLIPGLIFYVRKILLPEPSPIFSVIYFFGGNFLFELAILLRSGEWNQKGLAVFVSFVLINSLFGVAVFAIGKYLLMRYKKKI